MPHNFGWKRSTNPNDPHILKYVPQQKTVVFPQSLDLRPNCKSIQIYDQGDLGSCTANAVCFAYRYTEMIQNLAHIFSPSRLFLYYNTRALMNELNTDSGASLQDTIKTAATSGVCSESLWKYDITQFTIKPTQACYDQASTAKVLTYASVAQNLDAIKSALASGYPVVFGFDVYISFLSIGVDGIMPIPSSTEPIIGGHAVTIVGYDDSIKFSNTVSGGFIIRNSWGSSWGDNGYFYMSYTCALDMLHASDFWIIQTIMESDISDDPIPITNPSMDINVNVTIDSLVDPSVSIGTVTLQCNGKNYVFVKQ
jgi:C1A family cysteine protease